MNTALQPSAGPARTIVPPKAAPGLEDLARTIQAFGWSMQATTLAQATGIPVSRDLESPDTPIPQRSMAHEHSFFRLGDFVTEGLRMQWDQWVRLMRAYRYKHLFSISAGSADEVVRIHDQVASFLGKAPANIYDFQDARERMLRSDFERSRDADRKENELLRSRLAEAVEAANSDRVAMQSLQEKLASLQQEYTSAVASLEEQIAVARASQEARLAAALEDQKRHLSAEHDAALERLRAEQADQLREMQSREAQAHSLISSGAYVERSVVEARDAQISALKITIEDQHQRNADLSNALQAEREHVEALKARLAEMAKSVDAAAAPASSATESELLELRSKLHDIQRELREQRAFAATRSKEARREYMEVYQRAQEYIQVIRRKSASIEAQKEALRVQKQRTTELAAEVEGLKGMQVDQSRTLIVAVTVALVLGASVALLAIYG